VSDTLTINCAVNQHDMCHGYIGPLSYGDSRPCQCPCHSALNPRDYQGALATAAMHHYGGAT
jgi:hypothetical protein